MHPVKHGFTRHRIRPKIPRYIICAHKRRTEMLLDPLDLYKEITATLTASLCTVPSSYLVSEHWEIMREASALANRRKLPFEPAPRLNSDLYFPPNSPSTTMVVIKGLLTYFCEIVVIWLQFHLVSCCVKTLKIHEHIGKATGNIEQIIELVIGQLLYCKQMNFRRTMKTLNL